MVNSGGGARESSNEQKEKRKQTIGWLVGWLAVQLQLHVKNSNYVEVRETIAIIDWLC